MRQRKWIVMLAGALGCIFLPAVVHAQSDEWSVKSLQQTLDQVYDQMIPMSANLLDVGRALAGLAALFYIANKVWRNLAQAEPIDFYPLLRPFAIGLVIILYPFFIDVINAVLKPISSATETMLNDNNKAIAVALAAMSAEAGM